MRPTTRADLPGVLRTEEELDELLTRPAPGLIEAMRALRGRLVLLGAGGKMGPTFALLAQRAAAAAGADLEVVAASRFTDARLRERLEAGGVRTVQADLLRPEDLERLPDADHVVYLTGFKFGAGEAPWRLWATNTLAPAAAARRYARSRIAALSTGNVYPLVPAAGGGARESEPLAPVGEYGQAAAARERLFEFFSRENGTAVVLLRLNYAVELRYGVLVDIASRVHAGEPVDVAMGYLNCIWQGDACDLTLRSLALATSPPPVFNLTGPGVLSVRDLAGRLGELLGRPASCRGEEAETALLANPERLSKLLGEPPTPIDAVLRWTASWIRQGGRLLGKPTGFEVRDGKY